MVGQGQAATRIKSYTENGAEILEKDDPYLFLRFEASDPASSKRKAQSVGASTLGGLLVPCHEDQAHAVC
jgi:hypothetical protein